MNDTNPEHTSKARTLNEIVSVLERVAGTNPQDIPLLRKERRISRTQIGNDTFGVFSQRVYSEGYDNPDNPGSSSCAGGQEQPISIESVRKLTLQLKKLLETFPECRIKWVSNLFQFLFD